MYAEIGPDVEAASGNHVCMYGPALGRGTRPNVGWKQPCMLFKCGLDLCCYQGWNRGNIQFNCGSV